MAAPRFDVDFSFVTDDSLRPLLQDYHAQAVAAFDQELYAATIVLAGGVLEGVLCWAVLQRKPENVDRLAKRGLKDLIQQATELGLLGSPAEDASWAVKDFRNYIHPYNVLKGSSRCDNALATSALSAVVEILRSVRGRLAATPMAAESAQDQGVHGAGYVDHGMTMQALNFCWLIPNKLAGCRGPRSPQDLRNLRSLGICAVVRLADRGEAGVSPTQVRDAGMEDCHEPVPDFCAPGLEEVNRALTFVENALLAGIPVAISCGAGYGRTSTLLACYLIRQGLTAAEAIQRVKETCGREPERSIQRDVISAFEARVRPA